MGCQSGSNTFKAEVFNDNFPFRGIDCLYINSVYHQKVQFNFVDKNKVPILQFVEFHINRPSDEQVVETKVYF